MHILETSSYDLLNLFSYEDSDQESERGEDPKQDSLAAAIQFQVRTFMHKTRHSYPYDADHTKRKYLLFFIPPTFDRARHVKVLPTT